MWNALLTKTNLNMFDMRVVNASNVLLRAAEYSCLLSSLDPQRDGMGAFFKECAQDLQRLYRGRGMSSIFLKQLRGPADRYPPIEGLKLILSPTHALEVALAGQNGDLVSCYSMLAQKH